jgi:hypothetical protein
MRICNQCQKEITEENDCGIKAVGFITGYSVFGGSILSNRKEIGFDYCVTCFEQFKQKVIDLAKGSAWPGEAKPIENIDAIKDRNNLLECIESIQNILKMEYSRPTIQKENEVMLEIHHINEILRKYKG